MTAEYGPADLDGVRLLALAIVLAVALMILLAVALMLATWVMWL